MATVLLNESETLEFTFDEDWQVWPWDELPDYLEGIERLKWQEKPKSTEEAKSIDRIKSTDDPGSDPKAVDFLGLYRQSQLFFIEVKDCRVDPTSNRSRVGAPLAIEVGMKTRDTIAGVVGAHHRVDPSQWQPVVDILADRTAALHVVLWLEMIPTNPAGGRRNRLVQTAPANASIMQSALKTKVAWLGGRSRVVSLQSNSLPGVVVRNLPGAGMPARIGASGHE